MTPTDILAYYTQQGPMTDPREHSALYDALPNDVAGLVKALQGLHLHVFWAKAYGVDLSDARKNETNIRPVARKLTRLLELDSAPLTQPRAQELKLVGNCRDFTVLAVSMLRAKGIPARSRCGFGTYFVPDHYEDHWVLEYWNAAEARWVWVDAQLDELQQKALELTFNPLDMPEGAFVTGGAAWQMARSGAADPDHFGIFDMRGIDFILGDLMRDFLALNKFEVLPWDDFNLLCTAVAAKEPEEIALIDQIADICVRADVSAARALYEAHPNLRAPLDWAN